MIEDKHYERLEGHDLCPWPGARLYMLSHPIHHHSEALGLQVAVASGYTFDGPTGLPLMGRRTRALMRAAAFHDALYHPMGMTYVNMPAGMERLDRRTADRFFDEVAKIDGAPWILRYLARTLIAWFGDEFWEEGKDGVYADPAS